MNGIGSGMSCSWVQGYVFWLSLLKPLKNSVVFYFFCFFCFFNRSSRALKLFPPRFFLGQEFTTQQEGLQVINEKYTSN